MGRAKALLPIGSEVMLQRVVRILATHARPIAVVAAADQELPDLAETWQHANHPHSDDTARGSSILIARDPVEYRGPLAGLAAGMTQLRGEADVVYASACDAPLLKPAFIRAMIDALGDADIAVPFDGRYHHPLAAVYRLSVLPVIEELLAADRLRPVFLFEKFRTREVPVEELRLVDPLLDSLCNTNTPEEYEQALARMAAEACMSQKSRWLPDSAPSPPRAMWLSGETCRGGEGGGEGATPHALNPSPRPSPHSHVLPEGHVASGERGQRTTATDFSDAHTAEESP